MEIPLVLIFLGALIFFSHTVNALFARIRTPSVLLLLLIGIIVGPVTGLISVDYFGEFGRVFTTMTLIIILFESGTGLKFAELRRSIGVASLFTLVNFVICIAIITIATYLLTDLSLLSSVFVGAILGGTSSAVVIPLVKQLRLSGQPKTILVLESALSDVLCLVVGLAVLEGMMIGDISIGRVINNMWQSFLFATSLGLMFGLLWSLFLNFIRNIKNAMFMNLALVFILYGIVEMIGLNGGIAVLSFGVLLGNAQTLNQTVLFRKLHFLTAADYNSNEKDFFSEIVFIVQTYFFVFIGISIQFGQLSIYAIGLIITLILLMSRPLSVFVLIGRKEATPRERSLMMVMGPKGLVAAVLASLPLMMGLPGGSVIQDLGYSIVLFSIFIVSILAIFFSRENRLINNTSDIPDGKNDINHRIENTQ